MSLINFRLATKYYISWIWTEYMEFRHQLWAINLVWLIGVVFGGLAWGFINAFINIFQWYLSILELVEFLIFVTSHPGSVGRLLSEPFGSEQSLIIAGFLFVIGLLGAWYIVIKNRSSNRQLLYLPSFLVFGPGISLILLNYFSNNLEIEQSIN